jgi:hypothetical protein
MSEEIKLTLEIDGVKSERSISYNQYKILRDIHGVDALTKHIDSMWEEIIKSGNLIYPIER